VQTDLAALGEDESGAGVVRLRCLAIKQRASLVIREKEGVGGDSFEVLVCSVNFIHITL
jgi:hypothetical protein